MASNPDNGSQPPYGNERIGERINSGLAELLLEAVENGVAIYEAVGDGEDFIFVAFNRAAERIEGISRARLLGRKITEAFPGVEDFGLLDVLRRVWRGGSSEHFPMRFYADDRISGWRDNVVSRLPDGRIVAVYSDKTAEKQREEELERQNAILKTEVERREAVEEAARENERQVRVLIDSLPILIGYIDAGQRWRLNNREYENWTGRDPSELRGRHIREGLGDRAYERIRPYVERALSGETVTYESRVPYDFGGTRDIIATYIPDRTPNGEISGFFSTVRDVTRQKEMERAMARQDRLAMLGQLTGTVAHEIRNPLGVVATSLGSIRRRMKAPDDGLSNALDRADRNIRRCDKIISDLLDFGRVREIQLERIAVGAWIEQTLRRDTRSGDENLVLDIADRESAAMLDPERFERALSNLIDNARQAMDEDVAPENDTGLPREKRIDVFCRSDGNHILIQVADTGPGIPADRLDEVLKPLYSTKQTGTGLGLPTVQRIMEEHDGDLALESEVGVGTRVTLRLPRAP